MSFFSHSKQLFTRKEVRYFRAFVLLLFCVSVFSLFLQAAVFMSGTSTVLVGEQTLRYLATVGAQAQVPENGFNSLAQQLKEKEQLLIAKEAELEKQQALLEERSSSQRERILFLYSAVISVLLFLLVVVNFYLDYRWRKSSPHHQPSFSLGG